MDPWQLLASGFSKDEVHDVVVPISFGRRQHILAGLAAAGLQVSVRFAITPQAVHIAPLRRAVEHRAQAVVQMRLNQDYKTGQAGLSGTIICQARPQNVVSSRV
jgi:hypothetical protein